MKPGLQMTPPTPFSTLMKSLYIMHPVKNKQGGGVVPLCEEGFLKMVLGKGFPVTKNPCGKSMIGKTGIRALRMAVNFF